MSEKNSISVGIIGDWGIQPGVSLRARFPLKQFEQQTLSLDPQLAYFSQFGVHQNYVVGTDIGLYRPRSARKTYWGFTVGLQYQFRSFLASQSVDLGSGDMPNMMREPESYLVPNLGIEYGGRLNDRLGWYTRLVLGYRYGLSQPDELMVRIEAGLTYWL